MITLKDGTILRNLEEQVLENKQQIAKHWNVDRVLADFGIKMLGRFDNYDYIKDIDEGENYGNAYLIGTEEPYDVYVWTRADENAGKPEPYWLDIGPISLVGPQGPEGPQGERGIQGLSTKWYASNLSPSNPENYELNDQYLNTTNGNVYELDAYVSGQKYWRYTGNIRGPQGTQGPQGIQGERGPQGEPGPQGERGDVGGFINIWGILTQSSQLPTPSSLNNMTVAYLIGTTVPYDLWIQVGENSATAIWQNTGPFNAATAVSVGGVYQNVWNADTKLDKISTSGSYQQAYVKNANGTQGMMNITTGTAGSTLVQRASDGNIAVTYPNNDSSATSRAYVNDKFVAKNTVASNIVYGKEGGEEKAYDVGTAANPNYIVKRYASGHIHVPLIPTADVQATSKSYVDNNFVAQKEYVDTPGLSGTDGYAHGRAYIVNYNGEEETVPICNQANNYSICWRDGSANIYVDDPTQVLHCVNKRYFEEHSTAIYKHVITVKETAVGPSDAIKSMIIYSNRKNAYASLNYDLMLEVISCYCEIATKTTQGVGMNTIRGFDEYGINLHGQSNSSIGSITYNLIVITNDTVTKV